MKIYFSIIIRSSPVMRQRKQNEEFKKTSLFDLAAKTIWTNKKLYCNLYKSTEVNQLACIRK